MQVFEARWRPAQTARDQRTLAALMYFQPPQDDRFWNEPTQDELDIVVEWPECPPELMRKYLTGALNTDTHACAYAHFSR